MFYVVQSVFLRIRINKEPPEMEICGPLGNLQFNMNLGNVRLGRRSYLELCLETVFPKDAGYLGNSILNSFFPISMGQRNSNGERALGKIETHSGYQCPPENSVGSTQDGMKHHKKETSPVGSRAWHAHPSAYIFLFCNWRGWRAGNSLQSQIPLHHPVLVH